MCDLPDINGQKQQGPRDRKRFLSDISYDDPDYDAIAELYQLIPVTLYESRLNMCNYCWDFNCQLYMCAVCQTTYYCSSLCQLRDWKRHGHLCDSPTSSDDSTEDTEEDEEEEDEQEKEETPPAA
jgi:hypothetical protein